jgi:16S rRNA (guanine527-N7)-methyltransferase
MGHMSHEIDNFFAAGLHQLHLSLPPDSRQKLLDFLQLLQKWNRRYNLTAITELRQMVAGHLLDSLAIAPFITGDTILDVGSGAGFPGIPLAVYFPQKHWTLLDSNGKKTRFLIQAAAQLGLNNVTVVQARVEQWASLEKFDIIVTRAVGMIRALITQTSQHLQPGGQWLFMKGECPVDELPAAPFSTQVHPLQIPSISAQRCLVIVKSVNSEQ